jgi:uncharacterized protein
MSARYFRTFTGRHVYPLAPDPSQIEIEDIGRSLSHLCRFLGHTEDFYSVAQHSVLVSHLVPPGDAMWGLLHDAGEAYLGDLPAPIKRDPEMQFYRVAEDRLMCAIAARFGLRPEMPESVKRADRFLLATEFRDVIQMEDMEWIERECGCRPAADSVVVPWPPLVAEYRFFERFAELSR